MTRPGTTTPATTPMSTQALPPEAELDRLDAPGFAQAVAPLFEGAPSFVALLAAGRPYGSYPTLLAAARRIAHEMPEADQLELIDSHPRIGAPPGSVSAMSFMEQGYDREGADAAAEAERQRLDDALRIANARYEELFGFRFVVFVAGRPRSAILPELITRLGAQRSEEMARALDEVIAIAGDRVGKLAPHPGEGS